MEFIIKMVNQNITNKDNLKYGDIVWLDNVFGLETYVKERRNAYRFVSQVRANMICDKINKKGNFLCILTKIW